MPFWRDNMSRGAVIRARSSVRAGLSADQSSDASSRQQVLETGTNPDSGALAGQGDVMAQGGTQICGVSACRSVLSENAASVHRPSGSSSTYGFRSSTGMSRSGGRPAIARTTWSSSSRNPINMRTRSGPTGPHTMRTVKNKWKGK
jgi:hypothetical protein